jgi:hypothetical protein
VLRTLAIAAGLGSAVLFVVVGLRYRLQLYGDGSIFSYAVAVQDAWGFHWHNISGRLFVYFFAMAPAEAYVGLARDAPGGIAIYGLLFYAAQFLGLVLTFAADRSNGRVIFSYACFSTACLCPLAFGSPTEMWMAHALSWPALALCHYAGRGVAPTGAIFAVLLALIFTHAGAFAFVVVIFATLLLRGARRVEFRRAAGALAAAVAIWAVTTTTLRPDAYIADVLFRAALTVFDPALLTGGLSLLLFATVAGYAVILVALRKWTPRHAYIGAAAIVAAALAAHWLWFDHTLHAQNRYYMRTALILATPLLGALAAVHALDADGRLPQWRIPLLPYAVAARKNGEVARAITGAFVLILLIHGVETAKFVAAWTDYKAAIRTLATGTVSDPGLGDPRFVSSARVPARLNRLSWFSTTPFLSVLVAPQLRPARLVVDPTSDYFWLSCETATASANADRAVPAQSRELVRVYSCLHRPRVRPPGTMRSLLDRDLIGVNGS